ncbi:MAG: hypothetical protein HPY67_01805 [Syntrophaceae bacterium]|nr:hypothetical protein [Syntrophaceae bacterium]
MERRTVIALALALLLLLVSWSAAAQQTEKGIQPLQTQEKPDLKPLPEKKPAQTAPAAQKPAQAVIPGVVTKQPQPASTPPVTLPSKDTLQKIPLPFPAPAVKTPTATQPTTPGVTTVPGTQKPAGTVTPAKGATQAAPCPAVQPVVQRVAQLKAKLGPYLRSTYDFINLGGQMKQAGHQARQAAWKPYPGTATLPQGGTGVTPRQTSGVAAPTPRQTGMTELQNMQRIRGEAQRVHGNGLREAGEIRGVLSALDGEIRKLASCSSLTAQERQSLRASADSLNSEITTLKSYVAALQAQADDYASQVIAQRVADLQHCRTCDLPACRNCCAEKNRITGQAGTLERALQEKELATCRDLCEVYSMSCDAASDMGSKTRDAWARAMEILKSVGEKQTEIVRRVP